MMRIKKFLSDLKRILKMAKKPSGEELKVGLRISALGLIIIGLIAFAIRILFALLTGV